MFLIVFDLDGTLIDSRKDLADSANQLIHELGGSQLPEEAIGQMIGEGAAGLGRRARAGGGVPETSASRGRLLGIYDDRLRMDRRAYDGITEVLQAVRSYARLAVLTNKPARPTDRILVGLGLRELFEEVIGGDGPWPRKPDPASLLAMIERLGATQETTLLVGDSIIDRETAARASVRCSLAAYGFGYASLPPAQTTGDEWVANTPSELLDVIERFVGLSA